ncbi:hypothetical protein BCR44DRAFT_1186831 [Catenaria anguillulae PL171]|uniref:Uncharacterized protein n=1 Tax=Catenaria anguillulae PL171 TaxID=765915 RepID=A0A1Y2HHF6_9FUNG|nr:hypothetical protein BCR44DRAFT_1186831 [Catenaria anguillulae PL171]
MPAWQASQAGSMAQVASRVLSADCCEEGDRSTLHGNNSHDMTWNDTQTPSSLWPSVTLGNSLTFSAIQVRPFLRWPKLSLVGVCSPVAASHFQVESLVIALVNLLLNT